MRAEPRIEGAGAGPTGYSRRDFLRTGATAGAGLLIAIQLPGRDLLATPAAVGAGAASEGFSPAAWLRITPDGVVGVVVDEHEMGQGSSTGLAMILADELDADWSTVRILPVPTDPSSWVRPIGTGGSTSIRQGWEPFRKAGAAAREVLRRAAAEAWDVPIAQCRAENGAIVHAGSGRRAEYGELAERAAALPVPEDPPLKDPAAFRFIGTSMPRIDQRPKVDGSMVYGYDVDVPGMLYAVVARSPAFGGEARSVDDAAARRVAGVVDVVRIPQGVAVVARNTWAAARGRDALRVEWTPGRTAGLSSEGLFARCAELARTPGEVERADGDAGAALAGAAKMVEAVFQLPFLDHAPMEPLNCTAHVRDGGVEIWAPTQVATRAQARAAEIAGVPPAKVRIHSIMIGGGFGRRLYVDDVEEAVEVAKRVDAPVQVVRMREDTTRHGMYRPLTYHALRGGIDAGGAPVAWTHRIVGPPSKGLTVGEAALLPYAIPNVHVDYHLDDWGVPVGAWRSVDHTHNGFVMESFIDELAAAANADPYAFRREWMRDAPRLRGALDLAAEKAGWGSPLPAGRGRGIAAMSCYGSHVAEVAEASMEEDGTVRVHRVVCAIDCGVGVNPDAIAAQMEGAVAMALSYALKHQITLADGAVVEGNFHDYPILRIDEMPIVETHLVPSREAPGGVGEPGVPPLAAAVANAVFAATGRRLRRLPFRVEQQRAADG